MAETPTIHLFRRRVGRLGVREFPIPRGRLIAALWGRLPVLAPVGILAALPLLLLLLDRTWIFPRPDTVDPWMYIGLFLDPHFMLNAFPNAYHGTRLPMVLPGAAYFRLFQAEQAIIFLHLTLFYVSTFSLYFGLRPLVGGRASLLATVIAATNAMFLSTMGQTHPDAFGVTYGLLTAALVVRATSGRRWIIPLFMAGAVSSLFLFTNIAYLPLMSLFPWLLVTLPRDRQHKGLIVGFATVLTGFVAVTVLLCLCNVALCGRSAFFVPWFRAMVTLNTSVCNSPSRNWLFHASWLVFPLFTVTAIAAAWWRGRIARSEHPAVFRSLFGGFVLVFVVMGVSELIHFVHYLQFSFYASLLLPALFLAAGGLLGLANPDGWSPGSYRLALTVAVVLGACSLLPINGNGIGLFNVWGLPVAAVSLFLLARGNYLERFALPLGVASVMVANILVGINFERFLVACPLERSYDDGRKYVGTWNDYTRGRTYSADHVGVTRRRAFRVTCDAFRLMVQHDPSARNPNELGILLWYPLRDRYGSIFSAICSTYMWDQRMLSLQFPNVLDLGNSPRSLYAMHRLAVLGSSAAPLFPEVRRAARELCYDISLVQEYDFSMTHGVPVRMVIIDVESEEHAPNELNEECVDVGEGWAQVRCAVTSLQGVHAFSAAAWGHLEFNDGLKGCRRILGQVADLP